MKDRFHFLHNFPAHTPWYKRAYADIVFNCGRIRLPFVDLEQNDAVIDEILRIHRPGDVLLMGAKNHLGQWIIGGTYTHAGAIVGPGKVIHAHMDGVEEIDLNDLLQNYDHLALLRVNKRGDKWVKDFSKYLYSQIGAPYDFGFDKPRKELHKFYCSELVYWAYDLCGIQLISTNNRRILYPMDFLRSKEMRILVKG